eukprot:TRINITY_DN13794_c0_g1_i1.p1 TRINITY_DN13794_c0_g1~~TRINITY_DN13794_c0_g1_i1.p1  ORF type:complete len:304 (+),score=86.85 TRINITY_DN13794_c0_g1_i1:43-912(+)
MSENKTESPIEYVSRKQVPELVDGLMLKVIDARPEDPRTFMAAVLSGAPPPTQKDGKVQLFLTRASVTCHGPWILLRMANIEHELRDVNIMVGDQKKPAYLEMNPTHTVPLIRDAGGLCVWESNAIMRFLCNKYQNAAKFYPQDAESRAHCDMAMDWRHSNFYKNVSEMAYRKLGLMPDDADAVATAKEKLINDSDGCFHILTTFFLKGRPFICGDAPTIADFCIVPSFGFLDVCDVEVPAAVAAYRKRLEDAVGYEEVAEGCGAFGLKAFIEKATKPEEAKKEEEKKE